MSKTKAFSESPEGKRRMKACLEKYEKEGRASTGAGDKLITEKMMWEAVSKFIHVMKTTAADYDLPESVMALPMELNPRATSQSCPIMKGMKSICPFLEIYTGTRWTMTLDTKALTTSSPCLTTDTTPRTMSLDGGMGTRRLEMVFCEAVLVLILHTFGAKKNGKHFDSFSRRSWILMQAMAQNMAL